MPRSDLLKSGELSEKAIQKTVIAWVQAQPKLRGKVIHIPNEGKRSSAYGKSLKDQGMRPGVSDLFVTMCRRGFGGAWIELKTLDGKVSEAQQQFLDEMKQENYFTVVCRSIDDAIKVISWYCF